MLSSLLRRRPSGARCQKLLDRWRCRSVFLLAGDDVHHGLSRAIEVIGLEYGAALTVERLEGGVAIGLAPVGCSAPTPVTTARRVGRRHRV